MMRVKAHPDVGDDASVALWGLAQVSGHGELVSTLHPRSAGHTSTEKSPHFFWDVPRQFAQ